MDNTVAIWQRWTGENIILKRLTLFGVAYYELPPPF